MDCVPLRAVKSFEQRVRGAACHIGRSLQREGQQQRGGSRGACLRSGDGDEAGPELMVRGAGRLVRGCSQ